MERSDALDGERMGCRHSDWNRSGLLVTWLLRVLISKRKTREYKQQLSSANREVIYSIRAGIPEGNMPSGEVIEAMIHATARRYEVEASELYTISELIEELVKEVMDTSFLSSQKKEEYCSSLLELKAQSGVRPDDVSLLVARDSAVRMRSTTSEVEKVSSLLFGALFAVGSGLVVGRVLGTATKAHWPGIYRWGIRVAALIILGSTISFLWADIKIWFRERWKK